MCHGIHGWTTTEEGWREGEREGGERIIYTEIMRCAEGIKVCPNTCNQWLQVYCRRCGLCTPQSAKLVRERRMTTSRQCEQWHCCGEWGGRGDNTHKNIPKLCCTDFKPSFPLAAAGTARCKCYGSAMVSNAHATRTHVNNHPAQVRWQQVWYIIAETRHSSKHNL